MLFRLSWLQNWWEFVGLSFLIPVPLFPALCHGYYYVDELDGVACCRSLVRRDGGPWNSELRLGNVYTETLPDSALLADK